MAERGLAKAAISVTTLDRRIARVMEPRAAAPHRRIETIRMLAEAGVPVTVMVAPIVPAINDSEIEAILEECAKAGASAAGYVVLRLPLEIKDLFREWLDAAFSRPRHARDDARAPDAQRARLRSRVGQTAEGRRPVREADRRPLRQAVPRGSASTSRACRSITRSSAGRWKRAANRSVRTRRQSAVGSRQSGCNAGACDGQTTSTTMKIMQRQKNSYQKIEILLTAAPQAQCRLPTADCRLPTADCRLPTADDATPANPASMRSPSSFSPC